MIAANHLAEYLQDQIRWLARTAATHEQIVAAQKRTHDLIVATGKFPPERHLLQNGEIVCGAKLEADEFPSMSTTDLMATACRSCWATAMAAMAEVTG